jgi:phosphatidylglycerol:prolipoprotein diacylglycerol transferase
MHGTLLEVGPLSLHAYGFFLAVSFLVGIELVAWRARREGLAIDNQITNLGIIALVTSILGARVGYLLSHFSEYSGDLLGVLRVWEGGLSMFGGVILAVLVCVWYLRLKRLPVWRIADHVAFALALGLAVTRIGCFLNGCCFGEPTSLPWGVRFPESAPATSVFGTTPVHPTQLYESGAGLLLLALLSWADRRRRFDGFTFWFFILLYSAFRFLIDFLRFYDRYSIYHFGGVTLSASQLTALVLMAVSAVMFLALSRTSPRSRARLAGRELAAGDRIGQPGRRA